MLIMESIGMRPGHPWRICCAGLVDTTGVGSEYLVSPTHLAQLPCPYLTASSHNSGTILIDGLTGPVRSCCTTFCTTSDMSVFMRILFLRVSAPVIMFKDVPILLHRRSTSMENYADITLIACTARIVMEIS